MNIVDFIFCECKCGGKILIYDINGRKRRNPRYLPGHQSKGRKLSEEHKLKISKTLSGKPQLYNRGQKRTLEQRKNISNGLKGKHPSEETRKKMSESQKGKIISEEQKAKLSLIMTGRQCTEETKEKLRQYTGEKASNWQGGVSYGKYCPKFNNAKKEEIRELYDRKCFICNLDEKDNITKTNKFQKLSVHHIDGDKEQGCNGKKWYLVPLCIHCHAKVNFNREYWINKIREIIDSKR